MFDKREYYNQDLFWNKDLYENKNDKTRIDMIINNIPDDVQSLLDVGCGNGSVINRLIKKNKIKRIVGVDFSETALKYVMSEKYVMSVDRLNFNEKEFDIVICNEVLEHLTVQEYNSAIREISRIAKKYVLVTVPNSDSLESMLCVCSVCNCWFNPEYHVRSFNKDDLKKIFPDYECTVKEISERYDNYKNKVGLLYFTYYKKPQPPAYGVCPQCGNTHPYDENVRHRLESFKKIKKINSMIFNILFKIIGMKKIKKSIWLLGLYKKI